MRIGNNPNINATIDFSVKSHRVIIPIYIPNAEGYFADAFNVLKVCIDSLLKTINNDTAITLISNASSKEVNDYISKLYNEKKVDKVVFNSENVGKMNAIITETRASFEEFITYSDADVFFDKGWLKQTFLMFKNVTKAGFVSMNPTPNNYSHANSTVLDNWFAILFKKQKTNTVCSYQDLEHFFKSVGRTKEATDKTFNGVCYTVSNENYIIGAGHFCCTIRKTPTLKKVPSEQSKIGVSGGSEAIYLDIPFDKTGLWRISSPKAFVWHMGNNLERDWASQKIESLVNFKEDDFTFSTLPYKNTTFMSHILPYKFRYRMVSLLKKVHLFK
jgi:hypothetical protein